jgi:uncharacterized protein YfkK (UPF0435 family)
MTIDLPLTAHQIDLVLERLDVSIEISLMDSDYFDDAHLRDLRDLHEAIQRRDPIPTWGAHHLHEMALIEISALERRPHRTRSQASDLLSWRNLEEKILASGYLVDY